MRQISLIIAILGSLILFGCGGGGAGSQAPRINFASQVTFGDSLSDIGTYAVSGVAASGGGQFTINGAGKNWTGLLAAQLGLPTPCAAVTGGYGIAPVTHAGCFGYAQGGARVTNPTGVGYGAANTAALTYPVATQVANHLTAVGGSFSGNEIVFVLAGANDVFTQAGTYPVLLGAPYNMTAAQALATVTASITTAANDLVAQVTTQMIAKGARYVVVVNIPDIANTPYANAAEVASPGTKVLLDTLVTTFNNQVKSQLAGNANVLLVDAYAVNRDQINNPAAYGLTNVSSTACNIAVLPGNSSLFCTANTLNTGVGADTHYLFADSVHPTPYGYLQLARLVSKEMLIKGWL